MFKFVKLHLPPPEIRIFFPALLAFSMIRTLLLRFKASLAHNRPAAPAPIIITSKFFKLGYQFIFYHWFLFDILRKHWKKNHHTLVPLYPN